MYIYIYIYITEFACQHRVLKTFPGPGYLAFSTPRIYIYICVCVCVYICAYMYIRI